MEALNFLRIQLAAAKARTERGASAVEYGLLVALIAIVIIFAITLLGTKLKSIFTGTCASINNGAACS